MSPAAEAPKAYDVGRLAEIAKKNGLEVAEEGAKQMIKSLAQWAKESAAMGTKPIIDSIVIIAADQGEKIGLELADKIDGEVG